ncbi:MAG: hypothetical protein MK032_00295 [Dehalococcoidia bacterium]|nr:hypothetical protein [Dehalococcoidia bacterium]
MNFEIGEMRLTQHFRYFLLVVLIGCFVLTTTACASEEVDIPLEGVIDSDEIFTVEILRSAGMKTSKQYDVTDLPGGIDAWYGFIKGVTGPKDIEARFYSSHQEAIEFGTALAEEVSGDDANVDKETTTWKEGVRNRSRMASGGAADLAAWSGKRKPNYGDFVIFGNMILLCQGDDPQQSVAVCYELIESIRTSGE